MFNTMNTTIFYTKNFKMSTCLFSFRGGKVVVQENFSQLKELGGSVPVKSQWFLFQTAYIVDSLSNILVFKVCRLC